MRRIMLVALAASLAGAVVGCSPGPTPTPTPTPVPPAERPQTGPRSDTGAPLPLDQLAFSLTPVARGFEQPLFVTHAGDGSGRLFVVEQAGLIRVIRGRVVSKGQFLDVRSLVTAGGERGLLGLAFEPDFETSGRFYVNYTDKNGDTVVARFTADDPASDSPNVTGPEPILQVEQPYANHNGGCILFGPDGLLWIGMGDGGSGGDPHNNAQNPESLLGKMLTVDVSVPKPVPEIVVIGVRNPWRFAFDRKTGDLWIGDVGQNAWEEIDFLPAKGIAGTNLGWNRWEGNHAYPEDRSPGPIDSRMPLVEYGHDEGRSVTGGHVYRGSRYPGLGGAYLYADFKEGWVAALRRNEPEGALTQRPPVAEKRVVLTNVGLPSSFGEDEGGELYLCDWQSGTVYTIAAK